MRPKLMRQVKDENSRKGCLLRWITAVVFAGGALAASGVYAQKLKPTDYEVKAVYLFNFARLVEWPSATEVSKSESFAICVLGQDPLGPALDSVVAGENIGGRAVTARRISKAQDSRPCQVLYISPSEEGQLKEVLTVLDKARVLTVSDIPQFSRRGGMIQFVTDNNRIRFEVNLANTTDAGLTLSSELLKVAINVIRNPNPGV
jgi:hypothetical protein